MLLKSVMPEEEPANTGTLKVYIIADEHKPNAGAILQK